MIRILVADDHAVVREGLKRIIQDAPTLELVGEASDGEEALEKALSMECDMLLLDISMPGRSGLDVLRELKIQKPELRILILSMHPEQQYALRALRSGARGYLNKDSASDELLEAIQKVASGGRYISPALAETLAFNLGQGIDKKPHDILSDREFQVLRLLAAGKSIGQIAEELLLGTKTISTYRHRIMEKMDMSNNVELIRYAIQNNLVD